MTMLSLPLLKAVGALEVVLVETTGTKTNSVLKIKLEATLIKSWLFYLHHHYRYIKYMQNVWRNKI